MEGANYLIDKYISSAEKWQMELRLLRNILLSCGLNEELKWDVPCYTYNKANIVALNGLKENCVLGFFKGALLSDENDILTKPGQNTQAARIIKFTNIKQITVLESIIKTYVFEAIEVEKAGLKVAFKKSTEIVYPAEFEAVIAENPEIKTAFIALTPGRQKAYNLYFSAPKQAKTREARIEKCIPMILNGKGLND